MGSPFLATKPELLVEKENLPANFRDASLSLILPHGDLGFNNILSLLRADLATDRLDAIVSHLWFVGRPYIPRPLNNHRVLGREIIGTTDASLHLVWTKQKIFIRVLPRYLLSERFFEEHLMQLKGDSSLPLALGLLYTYLALVPTELDFALAQKNRLLPGDYTWQEWKSRTQRVLQQYPAETILNSIPRRFKYGELRLSRLDKIYRFLKQDWLHGYSNLTGASSYVDFLAVRFTTVAGIAAYAVIVLTAMQTALSTSVANNTLDRWSYAFAIFSMVAPLVAVIGIFGAVGIMFVLNSVRTLQVQHRRKRNKPDQIA